MVSRLSYLFGLEQFSLHLLTLSNVADIDNNALHCRIVKQVVAEVFNDVPRAVFMLHSHLYGRHDTRLVDCVSEGVYHVGQIVWMNELKTARANRLFGLISKHPFSRGALVTDRTITVQEDDDVERVFNEQAKVLFATA